MLALALALAIGSNSERAGAVPSFDSPPVESPTGETPETAAEPAVSASPPGDAAHRRGGHLIAAQITAENFATHHVGGPDADAGLGDWFLSNGTLCAAISNPDHESPLVPTGGVLIDLGHCGRNDDQWAVLQPMLNLAQSTVVPIHSVEPGQAEDEAWLETRGLFRGVEVTTRFSVSRATPHAIHVQTRAVRKEAGEAVFALGQVVLHASAQARPFSLLLDPDAASLGFEYPEADRNSLPSLLGALHRSDLVVLVGQEALTPISYGIETRSGVLNASQAVAADADSGSGAAASLRSFTVVGEHFSSTNQLVAPLWMGNAASPPSLVDLARVPWMDLERGASMTSETRIWISERADVASIADRLQPALPWVTGRIDRPEARLAIHREDGSAASFVRPNAQGEFGLRLAPGEYRLAAHAEGGRHGTLEFEVEETAQGASDAPPQRLPDLSLGAAARIQPPADFTGRLVFIDLETGEPLAFRSGAPYFQVGEKAYRGGLEAPFLSVAAKRGAASDRRANPASGPGVSFDVPPGSYRVLATRGPEYAIAETQIEARAGRPLRLEIPPLSRVLTSPGWIAADLHVHTGESFDSDLPARLQMEAFAASGSEVLVATEHDRIVDPRPVLRAAGLEHDFALVTGVEITSSYKGGDSPYATGHWNAFPVRPNPMAYRGGAPTLEGRRARDAIADFRKSSPGSFLQLNHPRPGLVGGDGDTYFNHLGVAGVPFDPAKPLTEAPNAALIETGADHPGRDLDYDGVELLNGPDLLRYRRTRADWLSLALQGERIVGVASSDSHTLGKIVGLPRTYVAHPADSIAEFSEETFIQALRAGRAYGSTGPVIRASLGPAGLGETHTEETGVLRVAIEAAPWVASAYSWRAYVNGALAASGRIAADTPAAVPLVFQTDSLVTVEVEGKATPDYSLLYPEFVPFAFTNPIYVDANRDGVWTAPGLPNPVPPALRDPDTAP